MSNSRATPPKLLLFDLGGVLIDISGFAQINRYLPRALDGSQLKIKMSQSKASCEFHLGKLSPSDFGQRFVEEWQLALAPDAFVHEYTNWVGDFYPGARELLRQLSMRFRVAALSNSNESHWRKLGNFDNAFEFAISSHEIGAAKPDARAFEAALQRAGVESHDVMFFDDTLANVQAARALGMDAAHTDGFNAVVDTVRRRGWI